MSFNAKNNFNFTAFFNETESQSDNSILHAIFDQVQQGIAVANTSGEIVYFNKNFSNHFGLDLNTSFSLTLKTIFEPAMADMNVEEILKFDDRGKKKFRVTSLSGAELTLFISKIPETGDAFYFLLESIPDQNPLLQTDDAGFENCQFLQSLIATAPFGVEIYDKNGTLVHVNKEWERIWNVKAETFVKKFNLFNEYKKSSTYKFIERAYAGETVNIPAMMMSRKVGNQRSEQKWIRQRVFPAKNSTGTVELVIISQEDITYQKQAEYAMRFSEYEFRIIWEKSPLGMRLTDDQGIIHRVNPAFCQLVGKTENELLGKPLSVVYKKDIRNHILEMHRKRFRERTVQTHFEKEVEFWNGKKLWLEVSNSFFVQLNGNTLLLGIFRDISLRKTYEIALNRERQYFESLFRNSPEAIALTDSRGKIKRVNASFSSLFDFQEEEILGKNVEEVIIPKEAKDKKQEIIKQTAHGEVVSAETKRLKKNGELIDVSILASEVNPASKDSDLYLIYRDIGERKKYELTLQRLLTEKDILLKEVYHRVKNNFQVISSLLNLQAKTISDEKARQTFKESQNRIRTMALVHEKLYQSQDLSSINLKEYLGSLIQSLYRSLQTGSQKINVKMDIETINVSIDHAIPCGLVTNEIFTNAMKYAFPENFSGKPEIKISCKRSDDNKIKLSICDNGIGMPENFSFEESASLGMRLVFSLVQNQLEGTVEIDRKAGTRINIIFASEIRKN